ncbi:hypothetical protein PAXINDRAFT_15292 [Paxillus involutus ATCC 200175]|uniref:Unplaced genomic scaffold PAXINscaffold_50, whole genome shotgun sequence n=1 Tax=Paxillus involutus ATCC 200175 TaxID=664439 RepID=A0A0C9TMM2_PAXIN|nr:hypothetical protein PAXINDRAFT_15292 [Paxillus involutus ATCC 200175]
MAFPPDIPFEEYVQAIPEPALFICTVNDVLSFYKEELDGNSNHISTMAARKGISKVKAFEELADILSGPGSMMGVDAREREGGNEGTQGFSRASEAYKHFIPRYFAFHTLVERSRLTDLGL